MNTKNYNTTDLNPETTFERHIFHRDQFAHYLRWTHVLKNAKIWETVVDFWCWNGNMLQVFYRNRFKCKRYIWIDIRQKTINKAKEEFPLERAEFIADDLIIPSIDYSEFQWDKVCSFEVIEHVWKQNADKFLENFRACGNENAEYYLSTPNHDANVWAAWNHTYDSWDWRGVDNQEFEHNQLQEHILKYFDIKAKYWTFASIKDYKHLLNDWQQKMFESLSEYYDTNLLSVIMAPFFPEQSRNTLRVLTRKK